MALGEAVPDDRRQKNTYRFFLTCGSAVGLALVAICFLATKGPEESIEAIETDAATRMQQLHQHASQSHLRSKSFLLLQGKHFF